MEFDNSKFESNVKTTMSTLDKLKQALNFKGVQDGAEKSASNISTLGSAVQTVGARFSSLEVIGITALSNITNKAINAGEQMLKSLTIEPVSSGFKEYELKMDSIRTIMASTGESLATVNSYLDELNKYSDETIYSFSDMTANIGKFTNAGVKLDKAVLAIKGVANEAAVSGANANEASRAMYNFAQALSAGYVKLIDWKSIENANMATVEFKQELLNTAVALKTVEEQADGTYKVLTTNATGSTMDETISATKNFNDSLAYQWMTTEVLTNTLANYADTTTAIGAKAQKAATEVATFSKAIDTLREAAGSGWAQTWQTIIGDREQATELFTTMVNGISDIIQKSADARNNMAEMVMNSSWEKLSKKITDTGLSLDTFQDRAAEVAKKYGIDVDRLIKLDGSFGESLKRGWLNADIFRETLLSLIDGVTGTTGAMTDAESALSKYSELVRQIIQGDFGNGADRIKALTDAGYDYAAVQALVNKVCYGGKLTVDDMTGSLLQMSDAELKATGLTEDQVKALRALEIEAKYSGTSVSELIDSLSKPSGRELLFSTMEHSISALKKSMEAIRKAWKNVFPTKMVSQGIYTALAAVEKFSEKLDFNYSTGKKLTTAFEGLFNILDLIRMVISGGVGLGFRVLKQVMENLGINVLDLAASAGEAISKFHDWVVENSFIADGITLVADAITDAIEMVSKWIAKIKELPQTSILVSRAMAAIQNGYATAKTFMSGAVERIGAFIDRLKAMDGISLSNIQIALKDFWTNVASYFLNVNSIEDNIKSLWNYLQTFISNIRAGGDTAKNAIIGLKDAILQQLSVFVDSIGDKIGIAGDKLGDFGDKISEVFGKVQEFLGNIPWGNVAAIAGMAGGLIGVVKIVNKIRDAFDVFDVIGKIVDAYNLEAQIKKVKAYVELIKSINITILTTAAAVWIVVDALRRLQDVTLDSDMIAKAALVVEVLGVLMGITKLIGGKTSGFGILAMAIGIKVIIALLDDIMEVDVDRVMDNINKLSIVMGMVAALLLVSNLGNWKGGVALLTMSLGLTLLLGVVKIASAMKTSTIDKGVSALWKMFSFIGVFELLSLAAKNALKAAAGVALLSVAIGMLLADIVLIGLLDERTVDYGITVLAKLMGLVDIMMLFSSATGKGNWKSIAALAAVIATLTGSLVLLSFCDPESIKPATACLSALIGMFSLMEGTSAFTKNASTGPIVTMGIVVAALGGILIAISKWSNPDTLIPSAEALSLLMASLSVSLLIISNAKSVSTSALGALAGIALITGLLGLMLAGLSQITDPTTIMPLTISLAIMLGTFVAALTVLSLVGPIASGAVAGLEALGIVVTAITAFIVLVGGINELCPELETFLDSGITVLNKVASGIGQFVGNLISGIGIGVTDGLPAIGENIKAFTDSLAGVDSSSVDAATSIASVIVALSAANVLDGLAGLLNFFSGSSSTSSWADSMAELGEAMASFSESISGLSDDAVTKAGLAADVMDKMIEVTKLVPKEGGIIQKIAGTSDIGKFGQSMVSAAVAIINFDNQTSVLTEDNVAKAELAANIISKMTEVAELVPKEGGIVQKIAGTSDIGKFGQSMVSAAVAIINFDNQTSVLTEDNVAKAELAANIISKMTEVAELVPKEGGIVQKIAGSTSIDNFGASMASAGYSVQQFCSAVKDVSSTDVVHSAYVFTIMQNIIDAGDLAVGLDSDFYMIDWDAFKAGAANMADGLLTFTNSFSGLTTGDITSAKSAISALKEVLDIAGSFNSSSSLVSTTAVIGFKAFCIALSECGPKIVSFARVMTGTSSSTISTSVSKLKQIIDLASLVKSSDLSALSTLSSSLNSLSSLNFGTSNFQNGGEQLSKGINSMMNSATESISGSISKMTNAMTKVVSATAKVAQSQASKFSMIGLTYAIKMAAGLSSGRSRVSTNAGAVAASGARGANGYYYSYYNAGAYMVSGFAKGIRDNTYLSVTASKEMALKALNAAKAILKEHSPSRAMYQVGAYAGEGFANGLNAYSNTSYIVGGNVANQAIEAMRDAVSSVNSVLASDLDATPTIRPVMDLSDVQSGMSTIGSIFNSSTLGSYGAARSVNRLMNLRSQYANNNDIVNAVNGLKSALAGSSGDTYQINGITYDDGSNISDAVKTIVRAVTTGRRV
jgi:hypothetical protein